MTKPLCVSVRMELEPRNRRIYQTAFDQTKTNVEVKHDLPDDEGPWLIITDRPSPESSSCDVEFQATAVVIAVGVDRDAEVCLPCDATPREISLAVGLCAEISRLHFANHQQWLAAAEVRRLAQTDPLTGLANRRAWDVNLKQILEQARRADNGVSLGIVDLDHFKQVNDQLGHQLGDDVLCAAATALCKATRAGDLLARLGGDEFAIALRRIDHDASNAVWERIRTALAAATCEVVGQPVTCSIGYVWLIPDTSTDQEHLQAAADRALRNAKQSGRNQVVPSDDRHRLGNPTPSRYHRGLQSGRKHILPP